MGTRETLEIIFMPLAITSFPLPLHGILEYYVYCLVDPRTHEIFYIGKGKGDRIFDHVEKAPYAIPKNDKERQINDILSHGLAVELYLLRHGLDESTAFEIEATLIDLFSSTLIKTNSATKLTNIYSGIHSKFSGLISVGDFITMHTVSPIKINSRDKLMFISINDSYMKLTKNVYDAVRMAWRVDISRANRADYVLAVYHGIVMGVYEDCIWSKCSCHTDRYEFTGTDCSSSSCYFEKSIAGVIAFGSGNPIRYKL